MFKIATTPKMMEDAYTIRKEVFVHEQGVPLENEIDEHEHIATHVVGYDKKERPFATGRFRPYKDGVKIERVAIIKTHRNTGLGKLLMSFLEEVAINKNYRNLMLNAQYHARPFYESLGYHTMGEIFLEENIEHIAMTKKLD
ncbi:GNAT family N-acetyltransferase [Staphylococcus succinus]|nr:GNAT family N-acetyltransferase [Staphylococcus succinus]